MPVSKQMTEPKLKSLHAMILSEEPESQGIKADPG